MNRRTTHDPLDPNRRHVSDAGRFFSTGETELLARIDVRGPDGRNGRDGTSHYRPPTRAGQPGRRGGDATASSAGVPGGTVNCEIGYVSDDRRTGRMSLHADLETFGQPPQNVLDSRAIGDEGYVFIDASGGKGGNGGRGGDGGPGAKGYRGRDATRFSHGTNGGPGGDGGNAGDPSDGSDSGDGGIVRLTVGDQNLGLLMLLKGNLAAGNIGFAGEAGRGGTGGKGGRGGSSYHWTETRGYTDSNGNRRTRIVHRSNPGGRNGRRGRDGMPSRYRAKDGLRGQAGLLQINVVDADGRLTQYPSPYDLELISFDIASEYEVLEPDSLVSIDRITIRNCGGMPTPENYTVRVHLPPDRWLRCDGTDLVMHRRIQPGETFTFDQAGIRLRLGDYIVDQPRTKHFRLRHWIDPQASMESGIARPFRQFPNAEEIKVRFPIHIAAMTCLNSLAPGESTRVIWAIRNDSEETFDQKYLYRAVQTHLRLLDGDLNQFHVVFLDTSESEFDLTASDFRKPVSELRPGQTMVLEARVGIEDHTDIVPYQGIEVGVDVDLQRPKSSPQSDQYRRVDYRKEFIRVSERYQRQSDSRFLLIANEKTDVNDIEKWTQLADYFGSSLDVWDVSYYGFLDLVRKIDADKNLLEQWAGMTIIIPNNYYKTPTGTTVAFQQLAKSQFLRAAAEHDINFYIVGDSRTGGESALAAALIPVSDEKEPDRSRTRKEFLAEVDRWNDYVARSQEVVGGVTGHARDFADLSLGGVHEFDIQKRTFLFQPKKQWLEREARKLQRKLSKEDPLHRWVIVHRYDTGDSDTSWGFFKKRKVGRLEARRTLDSTKGSAVLFEVESIDAFDREFINSKANKHGILLALKFEDKVDRFIRLVSERTFPRFSEQYIDRPLTDDEVKQIGAELVETILNDLYNEQLTARNCRTWGRSGIRALMPKLNYLAERSLNYGVTHRQMLENEVSLGLLYELLANIRYMAKRSRTIWDAAIFPTAFFKRSRAVSNYMLERSDRIATNIFGRVPSWWERLTSPDDDDDPFGGAKKSIPRGHERQIADKKIDAYEQELWRTRYRVAGYSNAQEHPGLTYDPELLAESQRVMTGEQFDRLSAAESLASEQRGERERAIAKERSDLLVPLRKPTTTQQVMEQSVVSQATQ